MDITLLKQTLHIKLCEYKAEGHGIPKFRVDMKSALKSQIQKLIESEYAAAKGNRTVNAMKLENFLESGGPSELVERVIDDFGTPKNLI